MTHNNSIETFKRNSEYLVELEEEQQHLVYEASYRPSQTLSKARGAAHGTQTVQRTEVQQAPSRIEKLSRDSFLRFRDEWVRNRARDIRQAGIISFNICSEDTASITALNEFYKRRVFDGFIAEHCDEKVLKIGMMQGSRNFGSFPKAVAAVEKLQMCRIACREKGRRVFRKACRQRTKSRV